MDLPTIGQRVRCIGYRVPSVGFRGDRAEVEEAQLDEAAHIAGYKGVEGYVGAVYALDDRHPLLVYFPHHAAGDVRLSPHEVQVLD